jgi:hypothetical protein
MAWMVVAPAVTAVTRPALLIVAAVGFEEDQVTEEVRSLVLPSVYVPVAVICWVLPAGIDTFAGVTEMDCNTGPVVIVNAAVPVIEPNFA